MSRDQSEEYAQDSNGDVNRIIDDVRGQEGNVEDEGGLVEIEEEDVDEPVVLMEIPDDVRGAYVYQLDGHNSTEEEGAFHLYDVELDDDGNITETTMRSVPYTISDESTRTISYTGSPFTGDGIAVRSSFEGYIGSGVYLDTREEDEPATEQRNSLE